MVDQTTGSHEESIELILRIHFLDGIKKATNNIVTARSLTTGENNPDVHLLCVFLVTLYKFYKRHTIRIGEEFLDFFLITNTLSRFSFYNLNSTLKALGKFRLISSTLLLQKTDFHFAN